jgi:ligand-binding sensor domain-containing protein
MYPRSGPREKKDVRCSVTSNEIDPARMKGKPPEAECRFDSDCDHSNTMACQAGIPRFLLSLLAMVALFVSGAHSAATQKSTNDGLIKLPVIDKHDIRFAPLSVAGKQFRRPVKAIAQDNYGFVWLGTDDGLYRYDGYTLRPYRHDPNDPRSLSDDSVFAIYKDRSGVLWIGTGYGGLDRFDPAQDAFRHYRHDPNNSHSLRGGNILSIHQDLAGSLWIGTEFGLDRLDVANGRFFHYPHPSDKPGTYAIWGLYEDGQGNLLVGCAQGLYQLERSSSRFSLFSNNPLVPKELEGRYIEWFAQDRRGTLVFTLPYENIFGALNTKTGELKHYAFKLDGRSQPLIRVSRAHEDRNGVLWIGTVRDGLLRFDQGRRNFIRYSTGVDTGISGQVSALLEDSEGSMWVGSQSGVTRFETAALQSMNYQHEARNPNSLRSNKVLSVYADTQGFLWVGTEEGLQRVDRKSGKVLLYQHEPKDPSSLSFNEVSAIKEDGSGGLWIGTRGGGMNRFDRASGRFFAYRHDPKNPQSLSSDIVDCLWVEPGGAVWIGTEGAGVNRLDPTTGQFKIYRNDVRDLNSLSQDYVNVISTDHTGTLWVGTNRGLDRLDRSTERFTVYLHDERDPASLSQDGITSIYEDHHGTLWIGTHQGLDRLDRTRGSFESFTTQVGLANDDIEAIQEDSHGNLWLATQEGLSEFHPQTKLCATIRRRTAYSAITRIQAGQQGTEVV